VSAGSGQKPGVGVPAIQAEVGTMHVPETPLAV